MQKAVPAFDPVLGHSDFETGDPISNLFDSALMNDDHVRVPPAAQLEYRPKVY
jgi:hypothetical protein